MNEPGSSGWESPWRTDGESRAEGSVPRLSSDWIRCVISRHPPCVESLQRIGGASAMQRDLVDADLDGFVFEKRVAMPGRGKSGSVRTLLAFKQAHHVFFVYGFAKSVRANISAAELKALRRLAEELLSYEDTQIDKAIGVKELFEAETDDE
jgi:hypothetical protein